MNLEQDATSKTNNIQIKRLDFYLWQRLSSYKERDEQFNLEDILMMGQPR
jgi:hypothetical protein